MSVEKIILENYRNWGKLVLPTKSDIAANPDYDYSDLEYRFLVDRRGEQESLVTADEVVVTGYPSSNFLPKELRSRRRERWIQIEVTPKDPYRPLLGACTQWGVEDDLFIEYSIIYLSNQGRAFEEGEWTDVSDGNLDGEQTLNAVWLKNKPKESEIQNWFEEDPVWSISTEPLQALKGHTLERLDFLLMKVKRGEIFLIDI